MIIKSFAKVNLNLKVGKRKKNYHKINSIITIVDDFFDEIEIEQNEKNCDQLFCNFKELENENFIFKVLKILREEKIITNFYKIKIEKKIPIGSGLGGGSSNAIAVAKIFTSNKKVLKKIAKYVGTDCYFFISDYKTAVVKKFGQKVSPLNLNLNIKKEDLILTGINCSTKLVYKKFDEIQGWKNKWEKNMLELPTLQLYPELIEYREYGQMSGSGSTFIKKTSLIK